MKTTKLSILSITLFSLFSISSYSGNTGVEMSVHDEAMVANLKSLQNLEKIKKTTDAFTKKAKRQINSELNDSEQSNCRKAKSKAQIQKEIQKAIRSAIKEGKQVDHSVMIQKHSKACSKQSSL